MSEININSNVFKNPFDFLWTTLGSEATQIEIELPADGRERRHQYTEEQIKDKIEHCRVYWKNYFSAETGKRQSKPFLCRIFHSEYGCCPHCLEQRAIEIQKRAIRASHEAKKASESVFYVDVDAFERNSYARELGKDNYLACPQPNEKVRIFYRASQPINEQSFEVTYSFNLEFWKETAMSPVGLNMSGNLGKQKEKMSTVADENEQEGNGQPKDNDSIQISITEVVVTGLSRKEEEAATREAYLETMDCQPTTAEEVEEFIKLRTQAFIKSAIKRGGTLKYVEAVKHKLCLADVRWPTGKELLESEIDGDVFMLSDL